jgi:hypothetical protein
LPQPLAALLQPAAGPQPFQGPAIQHGRQPCQGQGPGRLLRREAAAFRSLGPKRFE